ncbi:MAG: hypothetical protein NUV90_01630 [Candidatus Parcubacteria bacterium]|nr:hypothetical protein [Candidatus Parcubacteria bacterium]
MKMHFAVAVFSLALGLGIGFGINQPAPTVVKAPVAVAPAPAPATSPAVLLTSAAVDSIMFESMWTAGGSAYRDAVRTLSDTYAAKMDSNCNAEFSVQPAVATYASFVPAGAESVFAAAVKKQVRARACQKMNGARSVAILQS